MYKAKDLLKEKELLVSNGSWSLGREQWEKLNNKIFKTRVFENQLSKKKKIHKKQKPDYF